MSDENGNKNEKKSGLSSILNLVLKILIGMVLTTTVVTNLFLVYIVVAPDTLPKPFYLQYKGDTSTAGSDPQNATQDTPPQPTPTVEMQTIEPGQGIFIDTGTKIVNLADQGGRKFIRVNVVVEFAPTDMSYLTMTDQLKTDYTNTFTTEIDAKLPIINDTIITLISTKDFASIYTADGKEQLRSELITALSQKMPEYTILNVYFTEFVMQ